MKNKKKKNEKLPPFVNEPPTDFNDSANCRAMERALQKISAKLGGDYPAIIAGEKIWRDEKIISVNPCNYRQVIAAFPKNTLDDVNAAIEAASEAFEHWQYTPVKWRSKLLLKAAEKIRRRKHEFSAAMVFEVGKNWVEADMDTAEAIDFLEFYARSVL
ncbi:MAG: aldehyde dehydrogenase family protein, partial [Candidatus Thermochlorobacter sp.]